LLQLDAAEAIKDVKDHFQVMQSSPTSSASRWPKRSKMSKITSRELEDIKLRRMYRAEAIKDVKDHCQGCLRKRKISWTFNQHSASGSGGKRPGR
jgi:hypothetical protein